MFLGGTSFPFNRKGIDAEDWFIYIVSLMHRASPRPGKNHGFSQMDEDVRSFSA